MSDKPKISGDKETGKVTIRYPEKKKPRRGIDSTLCVFNAGPLKGKEIVVPTDVHTYVHRDTSTGEEVIYERKLRLRLSRHSNAWAFLPV